MVPLAAADVSTSWWDSLISMVVDVWLEVGGCVNWSINGREGGPSSKVD